MEKSDEKGRKATDCVHAGTQSGRPEDGLNTPIIASSAFDYRTDGQVRYPRYFNTVNHRAVADKLAALEGAEAGLVTGSGMGASSAVFFSLMGPGDHAIVLRGLYGGTTDLIDNLLKPLGFEFSEWSGRPDELPGLVRENTRLLWVESPTNPLMQIIDLAETARACRQRGLVRVIDNTFASPVNQRPLELGFDLVMHSATKYLGGHSDLIAGGLAGSGALIEQILPNAIRLGSAPNGQDLALLERSMKTLEIRVTRASDNALDLANRLPALDGITEVYYPGLESHPGHQVATRQMDRYGAMLSFRLARGTDPEAFLDRLRLIRPAVSLGGVESTICQPSRTSHAKLAPDQQGDLGIDDRLMRLSVGIEDVRDLAGDLYQALQ